MADDEQECLDVIIAALNRNEDVVKFDKATNTLVHSPTTRPDGTKYADGKRPMYTYNNITLMPYVTKKENFSLAVVLISWEPDDTTKKTCIQMTAQMKKPIFPPRKWIILKGTQMFSLDGFFFARGPTAEMDAHQDCIGTFNGQNSPVIYAKTKDIGMALVFVIAAQLQVADIHLADSHANRDEDKETKKKDCSFYIYNFEYEQMPGASSGICVYKNTSNTQATNAAIDYIAKFAKPQFVDYQDQHAVKHAGPHNTDDWIDEETDTDDLNEEENNTDYLKEEENEDIQQQQEKPQTWINYFVSLFQTPESDQSHAPAYTDHANTPARRSLMPQWNHMSDDEGAYDTDKGAYYTD